MRRTSGLGLVELLIAIPLLVALMFLGANRFNHARLAAHRAEVPTNVEGIRTASIAYHASWGKFVEITSWTPSSNITSLARSWVTGTNFDTMSWSPDEARIRGRYKVESTSTTDFLVTGECDLDEDYNNASFTATKSLRAKLNTAADVY